MKTREEEGNERMRDEEKERRNKKKDRNEDISIGREGRKIKNGNGKMKGGWKKV